MTTKQRISANAIYALKDALTAVFWFKKDLYNYAKAAVGGDQRFLAGIAWTDPDVYKRDSINEFVDRLVEAQGTDQDRLLTLIVDVANMEEFPQLARAEDPASKSEVAKEAVARLKRLVQPYEAMLSEQRANQERIEIDRRLAAQRRATSARLVELKAAFLEMMAEKPQARGYQLERLLRELFDVFDLDPKAAFKIEGEQIDGGFTLNPGTHFLLEAKWESGPATRDALDVFESKVSRKGENSLGLFLAIEGFEPSAIAVHSGRGSRLVLADGGDLLAVLEERIDLRELLERKLRHASMTGEIYLPASKLLAG